MAVFNQELVGNLLDFQVGGPQLNESGLGGGRPRRRELVALIVFCEAHVNLSQGAMMRASRSVRPHRTIPERSNRLAMEVRVGSRKHRFETR